MLSQKFLRLPCMPIPALEHGILHSCDTNQSREGDRISPLCRSGWDSWTRTNDRGVKVPCLNHLAIPHCCGSVFLNGFLKHMPPTGIEPVLCLQKGILSPSCLPVPPRRPSMPPLRGPNDSFYNTIVSALCQEKTVRLTGYPAKETFLPGMDKTKKWSVPLRNPNRTLRFWFLHAKIIPCRRGVPHTFLRGNLPQQGSY